MPETTSQNPPASACGSVTTFPHVKFEDKCPAINLLAALLRQIVHNINTVLRGVQTNGEIIVRSKLVYEAFIQSIQRLDEEVGDALSDTFRSLFNCLTASIPLLENFGSAFSVPLSRISQAKTRNAQVILSTSHIPPATSIQDAINHIHTWVEDRARLKETFETLNVDSLKELAPQTSKALVQDYVALRLWQDDASTAKSLLEVITQSRLENKDIVFTESLSAAPSLLSDVKSLANTIVSDIASKPPSENLSGLVIRSLMVVYIPFAIIAAAGTNKNCEVFLRKAIVWMSIKDLLSTVKTEIAQPGGAKLDDEFDRVEKLLNFGDVVDISTTEEMLQLLKLCASVRRPYSGRVASLVRTIYSVDQFSRKVENEDLQEHRYKIKATMKTTLAGLKVVLAQHASYGIEQSSQTDKEYLATAGNIEGLFLAVQPLFTLYRITDEWTRREIEFDDHTKRDEDLAKQMQRRLCQ